MHPFSSLLRLGLFFALMAITPALKADRLVVARSVASSEYLQKRMVDGKRQPQAYVFMPGRFFAGNTHDRSLDKASFRTIAEGLAQDLRQQDFFPAPSLAKADLLLVVHWGVTAGRNRDLVALSAGFDNIATITLETQERIQELDQAVTAGDTLGAIQARAQLTHLATDAKSEYQELILRQQGGEDSAALLGFSAALRKENDTLFDYERQQTLFGLIQEERYFVIVMAFDVPTLLGTKKLKRVWTLRASISSAGVNFPQALDRIGNIASRYFGTRQDDATFDFTGDRKREERVELGELIVLGQANP